MRHWYALVACLLLAAPVVAQVMNQTEGETVQGYRLDPQYLAPVIEEGWDAVMEREREWLARGERHYHKPRSSNGEWVVPGGRAMQATSSGERYIMNMWGDTRIGIGFPSLTDVRGVNVMGHGSSPGAFAKSLRVVGYRDGEVVGTSEWFTGLSSDARWFEIGLEGVDRIVFEAVAMEVGGGWYGLDDLTFVPVGGAEVVLDFEDLGPRSKLFGTKYAGLEWERGTGSYFDVDLGIGAPQVLDPGVIEAFEEEAEAERSGVDRGVSAPMITANFQGVIRGDSNQFSFPPDTCGAVGPNHFVVVVNTTYAVYNKTTGARVQLSSLSSFMPGAGGDPRVLFDQYSGRWIALATNFSNRIYINVSATDNPTGTWFKTNFQVDVGADSGRWPDFPTLGVDATGIYSSAYMVGGPGHTIYAIEKAPLVAGTGLGAVTFFPGLPFTGAVQPVHSYGSPVGQYYIERSGSTSLRVRRVNPPITSPTLTTVGTVTVPNHSSAPTAPALGASTNLDTVDTRLSQSYFRNGSIYTAHCINVSGRAACRWYQVRVEPGPLAILQQGTVSDPVRHYYFPGIAANANGDIVMGFTGSHANERPSAYVAGRLSTDPSGQMSAPMVYRAGAAASYNLLDGFGRNRWGDYSVTTVDPADETTIWTIQEYVHANNTWGTQIAKLEFDPSAPDPFDLVSPTDGAVGVALSPLFVWNAAPGASSYDIQVDDDPGFGSPVININTFLNSYQAVGDPLSQSTPYYWRVLANNAFGSTLSTPASSEFFTTGPPPGFLVLVSPSNGATEMTDAVAFVWSASSAATKYTLEIDTNSGFGSPLFTQTDIPVSGNPTDGFTIPSGILLHGNTYFWRATAVNPIGSTLSTPAFHSLMIDLGGPAGCAGDADGNGAVDTDDLTFVVLRLGNTGAPCIPGDVDGNGVVDTDDITYVVLRLGTCNAGSPCP